jgi:hypothetical protein
MRWFIVTALGAVVLASPTAFANSTASATLGPISVTVTDLDPFDGVTASFSFIPVVSSLASASSYQNVPREVQGAFITGSTAWDPIFGASATSLVSAEASIKGSTAWSPAGAVLTASGSSQNPASIFPNGYARYQAGVGMNDYGYRGTFVLSANTQVTFTASASVAGSAQSMTSTVNSDYAHAYVDFALFGVGASGIGEQDSTGSFSLSVYGNSEGSLASFHQDSLLSISFLNQTSGILTGNARIGASVDGYSYAAAAVPEPESYVLLLTGLCLVSGAISRKKSNGR